MAVKKIRVILDSWYVSATINKKSRRNLYELLTNQNLTILFSDEILREYKQVMARDKFKKIINAKQITRFMNLVISKVESVELKANIVGSRDQKDNFLLSLSFDGNADYLVTGDMDLLVLQITGLTQIITLHNFLELISNKAQ